MEARYLGDPRARPARACCAISATGTIKHKRDELIDRAAVCWYEGNSHDIESFIVGDMLRSRFNLSHGDFQLLKHFPEQFLIIFAEASIRRRVLNAAMVQYRGREFSFAAWSEQRYATNVNFEFHVKVRIEGVPVHCWCEEVAARALGKSCAIHYVEERTRRRERTRSFDLWAWCSDPCEIPKEVSLTVLEPDRELPPTNIPLPQVEIIHDEPTDMKRGQVFNLRNHLEVVQDLSFLRGHRSFGGLRNRKQRREFTWAYGTPDEVGERRIRAVQDRGRDIGHRRRHDDHEDDDHNHHDQQRRSRRHRSLSSWARDSRCRGGVEDCHSASWKGIAGSASRHYRQRFPDQQESPELQQSMGQKIKANRNLKKPTLEQVKRRVSFAEPLVSVLKAQSGSPEENRITTKNKMKEGDQVHTEQHKSPGEYLNTTEAITNDGITIKPARLGRQLASLFERPITKDQMEAILELVNQTKIKRKGGKTICQEGLGPRAKARLED